MKYKYKNFTEFYDTDFSMRPKSSDAVAVIPRDKFIKLCRQIFNSARQVMAIETDNQGNTKNTPGMKQGEENDTI